MAFKQMKCIDSTFDKKSYLSVQLSCLKQPLVILQISYNKSSF